jgi:hypothetical protein
MGIGEEPWKSFTGLHCARNNQLLNPNKLQERKDHLPVQQICTQFFELSLSKWHLYVRGHLQLQ